MTITAIIPTFNRAAKLHRAIESVLGQTRAVDEIIVVDDGSSDNTREVVAGYAPTVRYVRQSNAGLAASRNTGVRESQCDWVAFLDDDDEWLPDKTEKQVRLLEQNPDAVLCYGRSIVVPHDGRQEHICYPCPPGNLRYGVLLANPFTQCAVLMRKDVFHAVGGFNAALRCVEDWEFCARLIKPGRNFVMVERAIVRVYESANSMSKDSLSMLNTELSILDTLLAGHKGLSRQIWKARTVSRMYYRAAVSARARKDRYLPYLLRSIACWPSPTFEPKRYKTLALHVVNAFR